MKFIFLISTAGSVFKSLFYNNSNSLAYIDSVISDRVCGATEFAHKKDIKTTILKAKNGAEFSEKLNKKFEGQKNIVFISFYTKLFSGDFIKNFSGKIINFHPSILPACPGLDGFGDTIKLGSRFIGSTVHFVDEGIDTGKPIIQAAYPYNPNISVTDNRHRVYIQQCEMLEQVMQWFIQDRILIKDNQVIVTNAKYNISEFSPNLELRISNK